MMFLRCLTVNWIGFGDMLPAIRLSKIRDRSTCSCFHCLAVVAVQLNFIIVTDQFRGVVSWSGFYGFAIQFNHNFAHRPIDIHDPCGSDQHLLARQPFVYINYQIINLPAVVVNNEIINTSQLTIARMRCGSSGSSGDSGRTGGGPTGPASGGSSHQ